MKSAPPMGKVEMIQRSLRCFWMGLFGLLPVIGIPTAIISLMESWRVKCGQGESWNPAARYRFWGALCAWVGLSAIIIVVTLITAHCYLRAP